MNIAPHFLIVCGDGINCENETAQALTHFGAKATIYHVNDIFKINNKTEFFNQFQGIVFPGGFSFGDYLGSGKIFAHKIQSLWIEDIYKFLEKDKLVLGICNGFQTLAQLGLFDVKSDRFGLIQCRLVENNHGHFLNQWVRVSIECGDKNRSPWLNEIKERGALPVRHAEGRIFLKGDSDTFSQEELAQELVNLGMLSLRYENSINGSILNAAGLSSKDGKVFGLMPHPEAGYDKSHSFCLKGEENIFSFSNKFWENGINFLRSC